MRHCVRPVTGFVWAVALGDPRSDERRSCRTAGVEPRALTRTPPPSKRNQLDTLDHLLSGRDTNRRDPTRPAPPATRNLTGAAASIGPLNRGGCDSDCQCASPVVGHFGGSHMTVHSLSVIWSLAATPPLWLSPQLTVGKEHPLVLPAQWKAKALPLAAHSKWRPPISKMT